MNLIYGNALDIEPYFLSHNTHEEDEVVYYEGFDLMRPSFFEDFKKGVTAEIGCQYLLLVNRYNEPWAVVKWKRYGIPNHEFILESEADGKENYIAIRFVDVKESERERGNATFIIKALAERLEEEQYVVGGKATPKGKETNIHTWMKKLFSNQRYYVSEIDLIDEFEASFF